MNPSQIIGLLGWAGWAVGILSGVLEVNKFRVDRRNEPHIRALIERELRDKNGAYTEEQVAELAQLFENLNRQIRTDVPSVAQRMFLENRREQLAEAIRKDYGEYETLGSRIKGLTPAHELDPRLREAIFTEINPAGARRDRQRRRLYAGISLVALLIIFPYPRQFLADTLSSNYGYSSIYLQDNVLPYLGGIAIALILALYSPWSRYLTSSGSVPLKRAISLGIFCLILWLLSLIGIWQSWIQDPNVQNLVYRELIILT